MPRTTCRHAGRARGTFGPVAAASLATVAVLAVLPRDASAAPPWVDRSMTPAQGQWNFDLGLGIGHVSFPPANEPDFGAGVNLEMAVGLTDRVELGIRTGLRFGDDFTRGIEGDNYGRLFDRQYFDGGNGVLANPEVRVRWAFLRGQVVEMGLEGRVIIPIEANTTAGLEPGLPLAFHIGGRVRIDTGVFLPIVVGGGPNGLPTVVGISLPLDVWIQVTPRLWLGPMTGFQAAPLNHVDNRAYGFVVPYQPSGWVSLGFGLGYQITRTLDFKTMFLFPGLNSDSQLWGLGAGIQVRIE